MGGPAHLVRRFAGSLRPGGPGSPAERWVTEVLSESELRLWARMSGPDRRHAYAVARRVESAWGEPVDRSMLAAALLHDVGKVASGLRTYGRVVATLSAAVAGRETARQWSASSGFTRRVGLYLRHPEIGAGMLELASSDPLVVAWAREHHLPEERWSVAVDVGRTLRDADDD